MNAMTIAIATVAATIMLAGCATNGTPTTDAPSRANAALPPAYLAIDGFKQCLGTRTIGTYRQWCMPASKPGTCAATSWHELRQLQGKDKVPSCD